MNCNQHNCSSVAAFRFTWPGRDEAGICAAHEPTLRNVASAMGLHLQLIPLALNDCTRCDGCGQIDDGEGAPWTAWTSLPPGADLAVRAGIVKPIPCPECNEKAPHARQS